MKSHKWFNGDEATFLPSVFNGIPGQVEHFVKFSFTGCQQGRIEQTDFILVKLSKHRTTQDLW